MASKEKNNLDFQATPEEMKDLTKLQELYKKIQEEAKAIDMTDFDKKSVDQMKTNLLPILSSVKEIANKYQDNEYVKGLPETINKIENQLLK